LKNFLLIYPFCSAVLQTESEYNTMA
jgi:hypothetical protein